MAKHKRREQEPINNANNSINNNPFGIDPAQLIGLLGGNFNMGNMGNMLASMNTNGFNLGNLEPLAKMAGLNLGNSFPQGNNNMNNSMNQNKNANSNMNENYNNINQNSSNSMNSNLNNKMNINKKNSKMSNVNNSNDENLKFLMSLKAYIHPDKVKFIDRIIELYNNGAFKDL